MILLFVLITGSYVMLIGFLILGWNRISLFKLKGLPPTVHFSIVIPYRNEAENLPHLLSSFLHLDYPDTHFEILLVNDSSEDNSRKICADFRNDHPRFRITLLENKKSSNSPKKDAITTAIHKAIFPYILCTDADCRFPPLWLQAFNEKILKTDADLVAAPVAIDLPTPPQVNYRKEKIQDSEMSNENWEANRHTRSLKYLYAFQEMDLLSLQAAGAGGFGVEKAFMANAANLCYRKKDFLNLNGFEGNLQISSGDDVFLLQKFTEKKLKTTFLKCREAIVTTRPEPDLTSLISQRIRWAAKTPAYKSKFARFTGIVVLLMNFIILLGFALVLFDILSYEPVIITFLFKFVIDFILLYKAATFFDRKEILRNYFWSSLLYPLFSSTIAILSLFRKFEWKGRVSKR
ncbi:glycosyltransferase [soil metagenome]